MPDPIVDEKESKAPDLSAEIAALKAEIAAMKGSSSKKEPEPKPEDTTLNDKARLAREAAAEKAIDTKAIERALSFSLSAKDFMKQNESLLPKEVAEIFSIAEKENYSNAIEKDGAIKAGIIQSFFSIQENVDMLTPALKSQLDDYWKLTKTGKQDKAQHIYESIFEPTLEMFKRIKKAEALSKNTVINSDADTAYKNKLMALSKNHYLGEKHGT